MCIAFSEINTGWTRILSENGSESPSDETKDGWDVEKNSKEI